MKVLLFSFSAFVKFFNLLKETSYMFVLEDAKKKKRGYHNFQGFSKQN